MTTLQTTVRKFATINGGIVAKQAVSSDESIVTAAANNFASSGTYSLTVSQLAKNATASLGTGASTYTSASAVINSGMNDGDPAANRTVSVTIGTGGSAETVNVVLTSASTLNDFVSEFNQNSTKAQATVINVGTSSAPDYKLMIVSDEQGVEDGSLAINVGPSVGALDDQTLSNATDAQFSLDGIGGIITRGSNTVSDLVDGVTFNLTSTGTATVSVGNDNATTASAAKEFVELFNEIVNFVKENNQITREEDGDDVSNIFGSLAKTRVDDNAITSLRSQISAASITDGSAEQVTIFAAMGIKTNRDGTLEFDEDEFEDAMNNEPNAVRSIFMNFADATALTGGTIDQFVRFNGLFDTTTTGNSDQISSLNDQIARAEDVIENQATQLRARFARLEALIGNLQNQQNSLASILGGG
jgi:flagellar hook-associated protein 2